MKRIVPIEKSDAVDPPLDELDERIIAQLQEDGRRPYTQIAEIVGLSEPAVRQRVNRMRAQGVIQIVAIADPLRLGYRLMAMVGLKIDGDVRVAAEQLAKLAAVEYIVITAGVYDLLIEVVCQDEAHLVKLLNDDIRSVSGVAGTESLIYLKIYKQVFSWGTRAEAIRAQLG